MQFVHNALLKIWHPVRGFCVALRSDFSVKLDMIVGAALLAFGYIMRPLTDTELIVLILAWVLILITELQNTSIETALDKIHPEHSHRIGNSKDIASASAVVALCFGVFVVLWISCNHLG